MQSTISMIAAAALFAAVGCSSRLPIRGHDEVSSSTLAMLASSDEAYALTNHASIERHDRFSLGIIEFLSSGVPGDPAQVTNALALVNAAPPDTVFVVFVHGWDHDADARDPHIIQFRETLVLLARDVSPRALVGIYVSWPAKTLRGAFNKLTFLDRSKVAHDVSLSCGVRDTFRKLRNAVTARRAERNDRSALVLIGHSLGGKFLFTPLEEALEGNRRGCPGDAIAPANRIAKLEDLPLWGDFVLLVNPAQDVNDYSSFETFAQVNPNNAGAVLTIVSSESDMVVGRLFRWGRTVRNLLPTHWCEFEKERTGLGWLPGQITHRLCFAPTKNEDAPKAGVCAEDWLIDHSRSYGDLELQSRVPPTRPFVLIRTDGKALERHSGMFDPQFVGFARQYIAERLRAVK